MPTKPCSCKYAILRYVKDAKRDVSMPVGVALWSEEAHWVGTRFLSPRETLATIGGADYAFISLVHDKIENWLKTGSLPYDEQKSSPASDGWWRHLQKILIHKVRIAEPRSIECRDPQGELEIIFRSVVDARLFVYVGSSSAPPRRLENNAPYNLSPVEPILFADSPGKQKQFWNVFGGSEILTGWFGNFVATAPSMSSNALLRRPTPGSLEDNATKTANVPTPIGSSVVRRALTSGSVEDNGVWLISSFTQATAIPPVHVEDEPNSSPIMERPRVSSAL